MPQTGGSREPPQFCRPALAVALERAHPGSAAEATANRGHLRRSGEILSVSHFLDIC